MNYYLIVYNRNTKKLEQKPKEYPSKKRKQALEDRLALVLKNHNEGTNHIEAVVFGAKSLEDLKKTHGRYFQDYKFNRQKMQAIRRELKELKNNFQINTKK